MMISIVDDDESVRESTKALVRSLGYAARAFASAEEFLNSNPDDTSCLILDVQMEGLSGIELQERLIAEGRRTPIIFVSAFPDERIRGHALGAGAIGFLRKPFSDEKLIHCIDSALAQYDC
jgi:FixJ family two-component response regulator